MNNRDLSLIASLSSQNPELVSLMTEHAQFEKELTAFERIRVLSPDEHARVKALKRAKLRGRDRIESILRAHRA
ncbi:MAG: DUF465 domain-containing protein [Proteobacteria bacterium]|nr:DUF465 domain-containing protein [Pseudomonadota bacterium]MCP4921247.1 DUF465 domain-containing protein [Pseudomonadota bacterium]